MLPYRDFIAAAPRGAHGSDREAVALVVGAGQGTWANKRIETSVTVSPPGMAAISPAWSPDGQRLAYAAMPEREGLGLGEPMLQELMARRIWVADVAGGGPPRQITDGVGYRDEFPRWSADGATILFARINTRGRASLWIAPTGGGALRQVVDELTPAPDPISAHGHVEWDNLFDWRR
jgi:Tol biopolymer transport system component